MDRLKQVLGGKDEEEEAGIVTQSLLSDYTSSDEVSDGMTLSWSTRIKGFVICFVTGIVLSLLGTFLLLLPNGLAMFALFYSIGNLLSLGSTCFLMGPWKQIKRMFAETRFIATIIVFVMIGLTLCAALWWDIVALAIIFCVLQFLALTWYAISYIPFARDAVKKFFSSCFT